MARRLLFRDVTLRDSQQSAFSMRMSQARIDKLLPFYRDAGFFAMEVWGGAIPDAMMRFLNENPWNRLESIKAAIGNRSKIGILSRGRNLYGHAPYPDEVVAATNRQVIKSGAGVVRICDALNDIDNMKPSIRQIKKGGGVADGNIYFSIDPRSSPSERIIAAYQGIPLHDPVFTNQYFLEKALQLEAAGAEIITLNDFSGLITPGETAGLVRLLKKNLKIPLCFHSHCVAGLGTASMLAAIINGVDIVDTSVWNFAGGPAAPPIEIISVFCKKLGIETEINMEAIKQIDYELLNIRKELSVYDTIKVIPIPFDPQNDILPAEIDRFFNNAIDAARKENDENILTYSQAIESFFNFPLPDEFVIKAQIPSAMQYFLTEQTKKANQLSLLERAMQFVPKVRMDGGLPPLVTPMIQIIGEQALLCCLDEEKGRPPYTNLSGQFIALIKGEYGIPPVRIDPDFRLRITGERKEIPFDGSKYEPREDQFGNEELAVDKKEELLLELFPALAFDFLQKRQSRIQ